MKQFSYHGKASVEIVERGTGCTGNCSYCVIKKAKCKIRSRSATGVIKDISSSSDKIETIVLVADDCGGYGIDCNSNLPELIKSINEHFPHISFEIFYLNPIWIIRQYKEYMDIFQKVKIDFAMITVQSGSNRVIRKMSRNYNIKEVIKVIKQMTSSQNESI